MPLSLEPLVFTVLAVVGMVLLWVHQKERGGSHEERGGSHEEWGWSREEPSGSRKETAGSRKEPSGSRKEPSGSRKEPAGSRKEPSGSRKEPSGSRKETAGSRKETAESRKETAESRKETAESRKETAESRKETAESRKESYGAELAALKFLYWDRIPSKRLEAVRSPHDLFEALVEVGMLEAVNLAFLRELLGRIDPLDAPLRSTRKRVERELRAPGGARVPLSRDLLYRLFEDTTEYELMIFMLLLVKELPKSKLTLETHREIYKMKNNPHGYCLILNNHIFRNPRNNREGTLKDGEAVKRVFNWLQFETVEYMNLEGKEIREKVKEYSKKDHRKMDCFVCFILSHGEKDKIQGVDDECVNIEDLVSCFTGTNCPSLAGKPKVFIIQACQGSSHHPSVTVEADSTGHLEADATPLSSIPDKADILIGMSTVEDYVSFRIPETGSVYIQSLCKMMELLCPHRVDLVAILTKVNQVVAEKEFDGSKQMPKITSTLLRPLIFEIPQ